MYWTTKFDIVERFLSTDVNTDSDIDRDISHIRQLSPHDNLQDLPLVDTEFNNHGSPGYYFPKIVDKNRGPEYDRHEQLANACKKGYDKVVEQLLDLHPKISADPKICPDERFGEFYYFPIQRAAFHGNLDVVALLQGRGACVDGISNNSCCETIIRSKMPRSGPRTILTGFYLWHSCQTPLQLAALRGHSEVVSFLLSKTASIDSKEGHHERTALIVASENGHNQVVNLLLKERAFVESRDKFGKTALIVAGEKGHIETVSLLLQSNANIESKDNLGRTLLFFVAGCNLKEMALLFLKSGASILGEDMNGNTILHKAAELADVDAARIFLDNSVPVNATNKQGNTPLHFAARTGSKAIVQILAERGGSISARGLGGNTPLHYAARSDNSNDVILFLLSKGAEIDACNAFGNTAFLMACQSPMQKNAALTLLEQGASLEQKNNRGDYPLKNLYGSFIKEVLKKRGIVATGTLKELRTCMLSIFPKKESFQENVCELPLPKRALARVDAQRSDAVSMKRTWQSSFEFYQLESKKSTEKSAIFVVDSESDDDDKKNPQVILHGDRGKDSKAPQAFSQFDRELDFAVDSESNHDARKKRAQEKVHKNGGMDLNPLQAFTVNSEPDNADKKKKALLQVTVKRDHREKHLEVPHTFSQFDSKLDCDSEMKENLTPVPALKIDKRLNVNKEEGPQPVGKTLEGAQIERDKKAVSHHKCKAGYISATQVHCRNDELGVNTGVGEMVRVAKMHINKMSISNLNKKELYELEKFLKDALGEVDAARENLRTKQETCCICLELEKTVILLPCKHLCLCQNCSEDNPFLRSCPICSKDIADRMVISS